MPTAAGSFSTTRRRALSALGLAASSDALGVFGTPRTSFTAGSTSSGSGSPGGGVTPPVAWCRNRSFTMRSSPEW